MRRRHGVIARRAFTLVELLVVLGIIALLISILLPALTRARRAAVTASCLARLHQIGLAAVMYESENAGWIPGSGWTSGRFVWKFSGSDCVSSGVSISSIPILNECCDWIGPLAKEMGLKDGPLLGTDGRKRYAWYRTAAMFNCPAYIDTTSSPTSASSLVDGPGPALGYCTALAFLDLPYAVYPFPGSNFPGNVTLPNPGGGSHMWVAPAGYVPRVSKVGSSALKIYAADGARTLVPGSAAPYYTAPPTYTLSAAPSNTGWDTTGYADYGAFGGFSHSYVRIAVPGNATATSKTDPRVYAFRHGETRGGKPAGSYRMNAVFYDGHAEMLDDVAASNPALWLPRGTTIADPTAAATGSTVAGTKVVWSDVVQKFCNNQAPWIAP